MSAPVDKESKHVVILGGGVCGLYAARVLIKAGLKVTVLEKENRKRQKDSVCSKKKKKCDANQTVDLRGVL